MALPTEIATKVSRVSQEIGPTSLDLPNWIQAISAVMAMAAVAVVAWLEHRRAVRAELLRQASTVQADLEILTTCRELLAEIAPVWAALLEARVSGSSNAQRYANEVLVRAANILEALDIAVSGQSLRTPSLLCVARLRGWLRNAAERTIDRTTETTEAERRHAGLESYLYRLAEIDLDLEDRIADLGAQPLPWKAPPPHRVGDYRPHDRVAQFRAAEVRF